ncbi:MAG: glycosyltransferase family 4 protein [Psychroserpens sp.]|uniref:glycosyltransferase family 4 protein n=1 Tax=Psychroserpens sp. TaxID=2020870 RepID=UPI003CB30B74
MSKFYQEVSERLQIDGNEVFNFYLKHRQADFVQNGVRIYGEKRKGAFNNVKAIYNVIRLTKPDLIISNFSYINPAILCGKLLGVKRNIAWFHSAYGFTKPSRFKVLNKRLYLKMADLVIANSPQLQNELHKIYGVRKQKTTAIPFWTNIKQYEAEDLPTLNYENEKIFKIGCPGRLEFEKNQHTVIKSISTLSLESDKSIKLYIAGKGSYRQELENLVSRLKLKNHVVFLDALSVNEMISFYKEMDLIVLPSFHEAFGLVFIEALALGKPVLVSSKFGALDFIDPTRFDITNFSFNPHVKADLTQKINHVINYGSLDAVYYKRLYQETFDKEVIYQKIKSIFTKDISVSA